MKIYFVYVTFGSLKEARRLGSQLVKNKLAACVNINKNINSIYIWENKMFDEKEIELNFKTSEKKLKKLILFLEKNHPYECPPIMSFPIKKVNNKYLDWVKRQTN